MSAERRSAAFFTLAERGLRSADILLRAGQLEDAALFAQQVVERVARALLTDSGIIFGTSHNLSQMATALPNDHPFRARIAGFDVLSSAVTAYRYPTSSGRLQTSPNAEDLRNTLSAANDLLREAKRHVYRSEDG